jgi:Integrase core domain
LRRYYALFFIAHASRRVWLAGCTTNPTGAWVTQQARNLGLDLADQGIRVLLRDRDSMYTGRFDEVFRSSGIRIVKTPVRAPQANAIAERFVRTIRTECLDWLLILNRRHIQGVLRVYVDHYNVHGRTARSSSSHRNLGSHRRQQPPARSNAATASADSSTSTAEPPPDRDTTIGALHADSAAVLTWIAAHAGEPEDLAPRVSGAPACIARGSTTAWSGSSDAAALRARSWGAVMSPRRPGPATDHEAAASSGVAVTVAAGVLLTATGTAGAVCYAR